MRRAAAIAALLTAVASAPLAAQVTLDNVAVHGYGGWSYGRTTANDNLNHFLFGHQRGDYSHVEFALNLSVALSDRLKIDAQPFWHSGHHANQTASGLDYVFAEWKFSDAARLRVGSVKHPFGIYTEIFDVGTVRPFAALPQGVYGPAGMVGKAYGGIGMTGVAYAESGWGIGYDVYGGGLETVEMDAMLQVLREGADTSRILNVAQTRTWRDVVGGRVMLYTPVNGLSVGVSGYTGTRPIGATEQRRQTVGALGEYLADALSVRAEVARMEDSNVQTATGTYGEIAYRLSWGWQVAALYSTLRSTLQNVAAANVARAPTGLDHDEVGFGLNYWFTPNFVLKSSLHFVEGNRFAHPEPLRIRSTVANNTLQKKTSMVLLGGQLSF